MPDPIDPEALAILEDQRRAAASQLPVQVAAPVPDRFGGDGMLLPTNAVMQQDRPRPIVMSHTAPPPNLNAAPPVEMVPINRPAAAPTDSGMPKPQVQSYGGVSVPDQWQPVSRTTTPLTQQEGADALAGMNDAASQYDAALSDREKAADAAKDTITNAEYQRRTANYDAEQALKRKVEQRREEMASAEKLIADGKVDPNRMLRSMSTGQMILGGLALAIGGVGAGLTGRGNEAAATLNTAIERDIAAQRDNLAKNERMLDYIRARYGDEDKWLEQQRALQHAAIDSKLRVAESEAKTADQKAAIAETRYGLRQGMFTNEVTVASASRPQETQRFLPGGVRGGGTVLRNRAQIVAALANAATTGDPEKDNATLERINKMPDAQLSTLAAARGLMPASGGGGSNNPNAVTTPIGTFVVQDKKAREDLQSRAIGLAGMRVARDQMAAALRRNDPVAARAAAVNFVEKASLANGQGVVRAEDYQQSGVLGQFSQLNGDAYVTGSADRAISAADALMRNQMGQFSAAVETYGGRPASGNAAPPAAGPRTYERPKE